MDTTIFQPVDVFAYLFAASVLIYLLYQLAKDLFGE